MANVVIIRALKRELELAATQLLDAYRTVGNMPDERDGEGYFTNRGRNIKNNPRGGIADAQNILTFAAANYDSVMEQLALAQQAAAVR